MTECLHCGAKTSNGLTLCARCQTTLRTSLVNVSAYYADLARIRPGERPRVRGAYQSTPPPDTLPRPDRIADRLETARAHLVGWARCLADDRPEAGQPPTDTADSVEHIAGWLERHVSSIATLGWAGELMRTTLSSERDLLKVLDNADTGWFAGACGYVHTEARVHDETTCGCTCHTEGECDVDCHPEEEIAAIVCPRPLYATPSASWIRCRECGATYDAAERRAQMLRLMHDEHAPAGTVARLVVTMLDGEVSVERLTRRIQRWSEVRGKDEHPRLWSVGTRVIDGRICKTYRIGDVLALLGRTDDTSERMGA